MDMKYRPLALASFIAVLYVWAFSQIPVTALPHWGHDDGLFVRLARNLTQTGWLGVYDSTTLIKGPMFPAWLALNNALGLPLRFSQALLNVLAAGVAVSALRPMIRQEGVAVAIFAALLFNPFVYSGKQLQVLREITYLPLTVLILGLGFWWLRLQDRALARRVPLAMAMGVTLFFYWTTREEGIWIVPALAAGLFLDSGGRWRSSGIGWQEMRREAVLVALTAIIPFLGIQAISIINHKAYSIYSVVEFKNSKFLAAYSALYRVRHDNDGDRVAVPRESWREIYPFSPAARELQPYVDGELFRDWAETGCSSSRIVPCHGEISVGHFMYALRDAVWRAGYQDGPSGEAFYERLAHEVDSACAYGRLSCRPPRYGIMPPMDVATVLRSLRLMPEAVAVLVGLRELSIEEQASDGPIQMLMPFLDYIRADGFPLEDDFSEEYYLLQNPDVAAAVRRGDLKSGGEHYKLHGKQEGRSGTGVRLTRNEQPGRTVMSLLSALGRAYQLLIPVATALGLAAFGWRLWIAVGTGRFPLPLIVSAMLLAVVVSRLSLVCILSVYGMAIIREQYLAPASGALILFSIISCSDAVNHLLDRYRGGKPDRAAKHPLVN